MIPSESWGPGTGRGAPWHRGAVRVKLLSQGAPSVGMACDIRVAPAPTLERVCRPAPRHSAMVSAVAAIAAESEYCKGAKAHAEPSPGTRRPGRPAAGNPPMFYSRWPRSARLERSSSDWGPGRSVGRKSSTRGVPAKYADLGCAAIWSQNSSLAPFIIEFVLIVFEEPKWNGFKSESTNDFKRI